MGNVGSGIASGLGAIISLIVIIVIWYFIWKHNKGLTPEQKKKSDRNSWIVLGVIVLVIVLISIFNSI